MHRDIKRGKGEESSWSYSEERDSDEATGKIRRFIEKSRGDPLPPALLDRSVRAAGSRTMTLVKVALQQKRIRDPAGHIPSLFSRRRTLTMASNDGQHRRGGWWRKDESGTGLFQLCESPLHSEGLGILPAKDFEETSPEGQERFPKLDKPEVQSLRSEHCCIPVSSVTPGRHPQRYQADESHSDDSSRGLVKDVSAYETPSSDNLRWALAAGRSASASKTTTV
ncbi:hypothetical protein FB451DRAFT_1178345 [Mycena latifolia]|nr:hypothetical protein FB451DRAFT_1178345 [Mycena latifolia]